MTDIIDVAESTAPITQEAKGYIDAGILILQQARLDTRKTATLADILKSRDPYFLRSTRKVAFQLVSYCLDNYLLSVDEILFADFARDSSAFAARRCERMPEPTAILDLFAQDDLPLRIELLEEYDRLYNRLTHQFYEEFCDEDSHVDWVRLTRFISERDAASKTE